MMTTPTMTIYRRTTPITFAPTASIIAIFLLLISILLTEQTAFNVYGAYYACAYSIRPSTTFGRTRRGTHTQLQTQTQTHHRGAGPIAPIAFRFHHQSTTTTTRQQRPFLSSPSLLRAAHNHDCVSNATASVGALLPDASRSKEGQENKGYNDNNDDDDDVEVDEIRILRSMLEGMADLESFQASSGDHLNLNNYSNKYSNNSELSLLFPRMEAAPSIDIDIDVDIDVDIDIDTNADSDTDAARFFNDASVVGVSPTSDAIYDKDTMDLLSKDNCNTIESSIDVIIDVNGNDNSSTDANADANARLVDEGVVRARWLLVAAAALYGTNFSVVKMLGDEMPVSISTSFRFGLAALATLPWLVEGFVPKIYTNTNTNALFPSEQGPSGNAVVENDGGGAEKDRQRYMATMYGLEVGLWNSIGYVAQAVGLETTLASKSAFLCSMAVVIVPLLDWVVGKRLLPRQWMGALLALAGVAFLELGGVDLDLLSSGGGVTIGDKLSLVQPVTFGLGFWRMEQAMHQFPQEAQRMTAAQLMAIFISSLAYGAWSLGVFDHLLVGGGSGSGGGIGIDLAGLESSLSTLSTSFPWKEWFTDPAILFGLFWTGCITTALTIYMETLALKNLSAAETTLIFSTEPLWGTAFAVAVMGEQMGMNSAVGAGLILTACIYSNLGIHGLHEMWTSTTKGLFANDKNNINIDIGTK
uniref:EamA domain-containing protein n=1 Tax=Pseudo-nitzschia australis TaxID=44445 RepID=A0A7S4EIY8_9STRA|mmetsp:Transcript_22665/g.47930  ORF Transcript_22665/g.47930 Transcript_22665/m.47930 type:complete len:699 (+) Transcript_22665:287-2383(+)